MSADFVSVEPVTDRPVLTIRPPGSKSITNRALLCAAMADGRSRLTGVLFADDTRAMLGAIEALGARVEADEASATVVVDGVDLRESRGDIALDARQSGTTGRFVLPVAALRPGRAVVDGAEQLRARPFGPLVAALRQVGARVDGDGHLPLTVQGPLPGGDVELPGHLSSQFLSGLMLAAPLMRDGLRAKLSSPLVSVPYVTMTAAVMESFGAGAKDLTVEPGAYRATDYAIEPDASAASYFLAAAAITDGEVTVEGLGSGSLQGDVAFADILERMGARVDRRADSLTVSGTGELHGVDVDMAHISDTAQSLAAVAVFADSPTRVRGIGFIRKKETDRIAAIVAELRRAGIEAVDDGDGFTIHPGAPRPTRFATYDDHRMAMSLSLIGLRAPGIEIADPGCVSKTYPGFFEDLARVR